MLNSDINASALIMYHHSKTGRLDMTAHEVINAPGEGMFTLGAGRAFSELDKDTLVSIMLETDSSVEFLDPRILVKSRSHLVWYTAPQHIDVLFKGEMHNAPIPGLVYIAESGKPLRCFAFKGKKRPTPQTQLFFAPFGNYYKNGSFCTGNATVPKNNTIGDIPGWERFVLQCTNTHMGGVQVVKSHKEYADLIAFYKGLSDSKAKVFPPRELVKALHQKTHLTLNDALKPEVSK